MAQNITATDGAHYTTHPDTPYPGGWVLAEPYADADGADAYVFVEVGLPEGYTLGRVTPDDAMELGRRLIVAAAEARMRQTANREAWYGRAYVLTMDDPS